MRLLYILIGFLTSFYVFTEREKNMMGNYYAFTASIGLDAFFMGCGIGVGAGNPKRDELCQAAFNLYKQSMQEMIEDYKKR